MVRNLEFKCCFVLKYEYMALEVVIWPRYDLGGLPQTASILPKNWDFGNKKGFSQTRITVSLSQKRKYFLGRLNRAKERYNASRVCIFEYDVRHTSVNGSFQKMSVDNKESPILYLLINRKCISVSVMQFEASKNIFGPYQIN